MSWCKPDIQPKANQAQTCTFHSLSGMEHQLGDQAYDDPARRWEECHLQDPVSRVQSCSRVYWRIHLLVNEKQGWKPDP